MSQLVNLQEEYECDSFLTEVFIAKY
jgi:hypothetical protein